MEQEEGNKGLLILMADGNLGDHEIVKSAARNCNINHVFTSVYNGAQLLDYLYKRNAYYTADDVRPDVLIMDVRLDLVDGWEALEVIREDKALQSIPVYVLTRNRVEEEATRALGLGVREYFQKPLKEEEWHKIVNMICDLSFRNKLP